jgi:galactokinase
MEMQRNDPFTDTTSRRLSGFVPADADLTVPVRRRASALWKSAPDLLVAAPGRIEIVGNHLDYNGGEVIAAAIDRWVAVAAQRRADGLLHIAAPDVAREVMTIPMDEARGFDGSGETRQAWSVFPQAAVASTVAAGIPCNGLAVYYRSTIPVGAGLSSSSALLVALVTAMTRLADADLPMSAIARIAQDAEHRTGAPVGLLDQTASTIGGVLRFSNDPQRVQGLEAQFDDAVFVVIDSGVRHALPGSRYPVRVAECREALRLLQGSGFDITCLADVPYADLETAAALLPAPLDLRLRHIVGEVRRTARAEEALASQDLATLGELMNESGESSATLYDISHPAVESVVAVAREIPGVYGARMMGGGDGGAAIALLDRDAIDRLASALPHHPVTRCRIARGLTLVD